MRHPHLYCYNEGPFSQEDFPVSATYLFSVKLQAL